MNPLQRFDKTLSNRYDFKTYYGVKKGIYYIKAQGNGYRLKYSFKSVKDRSGNTKSKAKKYPEIKRLKD